MSAVWIIYLADVACGLGTLFLIGSMLAGLAATLIYPVISPYDEEDRKKVHLVWKISIPACIFLALAAILIPSKKTIYMMAAAKVGQDIVQAPQTKEIGDKVLKLINQKLDESLEKK